MAEIALTQGCVTVVDDEDAARLGVYRWYAVKTRGGAMYAARMAPQPDGKRKRVWLHKEVIEASSEVDHRDGDTLNNRRDNLRACTRAGNNRNRRKWANTKFRYKGISAQGNRYLSHITVDRKRRYLGCFKSEIDAALAYDTAAKQFFGEFACLNFPDYHPLLSHAQQHDERRVRDVAQTIRA